MSIRPLPDEVVTQIKSSTAVVSLGGVVLELIRNSLDAKASRIEATVDFARGACVVEDDGLGISPAEFSQDGGLGKRYWTSRFQSEEPHLGQHGTFLASLAAVSLLTITSHHHAYRSQNSISFHHAQTIERQIPTHARNHVHGQHGTRVTVRNLFGNMPVRVKQRAMAVDQKTEQHRLRNALKRDTVQLLLSWQRPVSLKIRDSDGATIVQVNTSNTALRDNGQSGGVGRLRSAHLSSLLQIMTQANYIDVNEWASWVPASASTPAISVKGAISLEPAPNKHTQFISFGFRPLSSDSGSNELYDQVNRLFSSSSFGVIEDDADVDEQEVLRRLSDKRYKHDGYTKRQLKARRGVDRFPMFHLRVSLKDKPPSEISHERFCEDECNLQAILDVFSAMITQWLSVHHFCPRKPRQTSSRSQTATASHDDVEQGLAQSRKRRVSASSLIRTPVPEAEPMANGPAKKQRLARPSSQRSLARPQSQAFADWSRIKSGKSSFLENTNKTQKVRTLETARVSSDQPSCEGHGRQSSGCNREQTALCDVTSTHINADNNVAMASPVQCKQIKSSVPEDKDEIMVWTDPSTKKTHYLNARTGCVAPIQKPQTDPTVSLPSASLIETRKSIRVAPKVATTEPVKSLWLDDLLRNWDNPIFKPTEQGIQRVSLQDDQDQTSKHAYQQNHTCCSQFGMQRTSNDAGSTSTKLSKATLRRAIVVSQVDKKFILVKMAGSSVGSDKESHADIMVLIDQHAADERVQVESLLQDLCTPTHHVEHLNSQSRSTACSPVAHVMLEKPLQFTISSTEHFHFETFRANFAAWSILYDISSCVSLGNGPDTKEKGTCKLSVTALPPSISERCKADPELLVSFLRSAVWKYADSPPLPPTVSDDPHTTWVKKIATCPPDLVDMINSRACRSAIMFNDELSLEQCKTLVSKLAECIFPFMCAHGRPSMVPIVDLGKIGSSNHAGEADSGSFVEACRRWKRP